jgi:hypothetical protein
MQICKGSKPYRLIAIEREGNHSYGAFICGPGTGPCVRYSVPTRRDAAQLVNDLNLSLLYARELMAARSARRRRRK